jgi:hypothetical protein
MDLNRCPNRRDLTDLDLREGGLEHKTRTELDLILYRKTEPLYTQPQATMMQGCVGIATCLVHSRTEFILQKEY